MGRRLLPHRRGDKVARGGLLPDVLAQEGVLAEGPGLPGGVEAARLAIALAIFFCRDPPRGSEIARVERLGVVLSRAYRVDPKQPIANFTQP